MLSSGNGIGVKVLVPPGQGAARQSGDGAGEDTNVDGTGMPAAEQEAVAVAAALAEQAGQESSGGVVVRVDAIARGPSMPIAPAAPGAALPTIARQGLIGFAVPARAASAGVSRSREQEEALARALAVEQRLGSDDPNERKRAITRLGLIIPHLAGGDRLARVLAVVQRLQSTFKDEHGAVLFVVRHNIRDFAEDDKFTILLAVAERLRNSDAGWESIKELDLLISCLTQDKKRAFAMAMVKSLESGNPNDGWMKIRILGKIILHLAQDDRFAVANAVAKEFGSDVPARRLVAIQALALIARELVEEYRVAVIRSLIGISPQAVAYLNAQLQIPGLDNFELNLNTTRDDVVKWIKGALTALKIDPKYAGAIYADMQRRDAGFYLFSEIVRQSVDNPAGLEAAYSRGPVALSRYLFTARTGIVIEGFETGKYREKALGDLYEGALFMDDNVPLEISGAVAGDRDLTSVRRLVASVGRLLGVSEEGVEVRRITDENIEGIIEEADKEFLRRFQEVFKIGDRNITMDEIRALEEKWGNLNVFFTLVARFQLNQEWRGEIPALGRVARAVLDGWFPELKYKGMRGDPADQARAAAQTAMLRTPEQLAGWQRDFRRIGVSREKTEGPTPEENLARSKKLLGEQVMGHAREAAGGKTNQSEIDRIKRELQQKGLKTEALKTLRTHNNGGVLLIAVLELAQAATNSAEYLKVITLIKGNDGIFGLSEQLRADIVSLGEIARAKVKSEEAIVFTTTTADPKLLLMTGDLVGVTSCQNYKTGSHIQTLLGYVVDAGVKLILTYTLPRRNFGSDAEFEEAKRLAFEGVEPSFDDAGQILKIGDIEIALPKAVNRHVMKLGETDDDKAGIVAEPAHAQAHTAEDLMRTQIREVFAAQASAAGAVTGKKITIPPSRNPGGVYSDISRGVMTGSYMIGN